MKQHDFFLIDRSGSMSVLWRELIPSVNTYVKNLAKENIETGVTVAVFDDQNGLDFRVIRENVSPWSFNQINLNETSPRGGTPLSDAVVKLVAMAEAGNYDKVVINIVTDGEENSSRLFSVAEAKAALDRCRKRDWVVTFFGADFQNENQAVNQYGNFKSHTVSMAQGNFGSTMDLQSIKRSAYSTGIVGASASTMDWTDLEKNAAETKTK